MNDTMLDIIRLRAERICEDGIRLLRDYSGMRPVKLSKSNPICISGVKKVINSIKRNSYWNELPDEGKQLQAQLLPEIDRFSDLIQTLMRNLPQSPQQKVTNTLKRIRSAVEQKGSTRWSTKDEAIYGFRELINTVITTFSEYFETSLDIVIVIPDTNALLINPDIEHWQFEGVNHFTLILMPTVLAELDKLKVNHKNPDFREKAKKLIRKIKEYRRRGSLQEGVPIVKGKITLRSIAYEPDMSQTLPKFDKDNADDRFLASALEVIRGNLGTKIFIVTGDINMQNKAEFAGIPFSEVPENERKRSKDNA